MSQVARKRSSEDIFKDNLVSALRIRFSAFEAKSRTHTDLSIVLGRGELSAVEVTIDFLRRAVIAQKFVSSFDKFES